MYNTGNIVRINKDGEIMFIGRRDYQVKKRGQKIEFLEIESMIANEEMIPEVASFGYVVKNGSVSDEEVEKKE